MIKYIETASDSCPVNTATDIVSIRKPDAYQPTRTVVIVRNGEVLHYVYGTSNLFPGEFELSGYSDDAIHKILASLLQARLAAQLAAPHVSYVPYDYREFIWSFLEEYKARFELGLPITTDLLRQWLTEVGRRVTRPVLCTPDGFNLFDRHDSEGFWIDQSVVWQRTRSGIGRLVYSGSLARCSAVLRGLATIPWQETITATQILRWARSCGDDTQPATPTRSIIIPDQPMQPIRVELVV